MTKGAFNFAPAAAAWWQYEGRRHVIAYIVIPVTAGASVLVLQRQIDDWASIETGGFFLTGLLMTTLFQVFQWGRDATTALQNNEVLAGDPHERGRQQRRLQAVERTYRSIVWATIVSLILTVAVLIINTESSAPLAQEDSTLSTVIVAVIGAHLMVVLASIINRVFIITRADLSQARDHITGDRS